jgi:UDP-N-acetylglucosamine--N-acetylmuramyl-(pentapeptide) pyrophosphoryl-undecaprenol N-acetylglucosamine transferase
MRVLVSGGGTGGHIYPALAVATQLQQEFGAEVLYVGSDDGLEAELAPAAGLPFVTIKAGKLMRYLSWRTVRSLARVPVGIVQAIGVVRRFRPQVAFTSGGYVAVPTGLAAWLGRVPLVMHQQDVPPNLANRLLAPLASCISLAFEDSRLYFPARKSLHVGNPVRQAILEARQLPTTQARSRLGLEAERPLVLVTGGSQGARHLNQVVCRALPALLERWQVLHISGKRLFEETGAAAQRSLALLDEQQRARYHLVPYLDAEMALAMQAADLVVCRAGAATLSELAILGKPSILVPLPPALGSSPQEANAAMFGRRRAALVVRNADLTPQLLIGHVNSLLASADCREAMARAASALARPDATQAIAAVVARFAGVTPARQEKAGVS